MNILIRRTFQNTVLALVRVNSREYHIGEGRNITEAVGNLVLTSAAAFTTGVDSIKWDMTHEFTKCYVKTDMKNETIYERANTTANS